MEKEREKPVGSVEEERAFFEKLFAEEGSSPCPHGEEEETVLPFTCAAAVPLRNEKHFTLREMRELWAEKGWMQPCPSCGHAAYVFFWTGSVLSGRNSFSAWCPLCRKLVYGRGKNLRPLLKALS